MTQYTHANVFQQTHLYRLLLKPASPFPHDPSLAQLRLETLRIDYTLTAITSSTSAQRAAAYAAGWISLQGCAQ